MRERGRAFKLLRLSVRACERALRVVADALGDGRIAERLESKPYTKAFRRS